VQASPSARGHSPKKLGASFEPWESARVRALLVSERYHQAIHDPQSFHIHPLNLALALASDIERRGGQVHERSEAVGLDGRGPAGACARWPARSPRAMSCSRAMPILAGCSRGLRAPSCRWRPMSRWTAKIGRRLAEAIRCPARSPTPAAPAITIASSMATVFSGAAESPRIPANRPGCGR